MTDSRELVETYFDAWAGHDFDRLRSVPADVITWFDLHTNMSEEPASPAT
jgi:hypothetical protein